MAFGFPAFHTEDIIAAELGPDPKTVIISALDRLAWPIKEQSELQISAKTSINFWSWGERITIQFEPGGTIEITSKCAMPTQCIDWGKNARNVQKLIGEISNHSHD